MGVLKKILILTAILTLMPFMVRADSDTLLTCKQYGYRVFNLMNIADSGKGNATLDSSDMQKAIRMAFNGIGRSIAVPKTKVIPTVDGTRNYLIDNGFISVTNVMRVTNKSLTPMIPVLDVSMIDTDPNFTAKMTSDSVIFYMIHGDSIRFLPIPNHVDTIMIDYMARPAHPNATSDTVWIPYEYKDALIYLSAFHAEIMRQGNKAQTYWGFFAIEAPDIANKMLNRKVVDTK